MDKGIFVVSVTTPFVDVDAYYDNEPPQDLYFFTTLGRAHDFIEREYDANPETIAEDVFFERWVGKSDEEIEISLVSVDTWEPYSV